MAILIAVSTAVEPQIVKNILFKSLPKYYEQKTQKEELISKKDLCEEICVSFQKQDCSRDIF